MMFGGYIATDDVSILMSVSFVGHSLFSTNS